MPTYEYQCQSCKKLHEAFQSITAKPLTTCPNCKKGKLTRLMGSGSGFLFKGSGFYITDYRSKNYQEGKKRDEQSKPSSSSSSSSSSCSGPCSKKPSADK
ncbi:MAG: zinc ribbon domain-containing protein [Candidatus Omnitrophica bacterium]|nr:zinc ribbon domain-containing protein [Candidatus Omnitrophota bacterium]